MVSTLPNFNQSEKGVALGFTNTLVEISKPSFDEDSQGESGLTPLEYGVCHRAADIQRLV